MRQSLEGTQLLLLDIEGTVCPISFVKETLFPYFLKALPDILKEKWEADEFQPYKTAFPASAQTSPETLLEHAKDLTDRDVKIGYLKNLQGYVWETGYKEGAYATPLFDDVPLLFARSVRIAIYSSGSVAAQKLLFGHAKASTNTNKNASDEDEDVDADANKTKVDDFNPRIKAYFDTTSAGGKTESKSYEVIREKLGLDAESILFLSDNVLEIQAALDAGLKAVVVERPGNAALTSEDRAKFDVITSFDQLALAV